MENDLKIRLEQHAMWLLDETKGQRFVAKNYADLRHANLRYANLRYADLRHADLSSTNLSYADLRSTNLSYANLRHANLRYADLSSTNLSYASLRYANLSHADLRHANLRHADLSSTNLSYASLNYANLSSTNGFKFVPLQVVNTKFFITILDDHVLWGCRKMTFDEVKEFRFSDCTEKWGENEFRLNKKIITEMIRYYRKQI